jgi:hypothetical protein
MGRVQGHVFSSVIWSWLHIFLTNWWRPTGIVYGLNGETSTPVLLLDHCCSTTQAISADLCHCESGGTSLDVKKSDQYFLLHKKIHQQFFA